MAVETNNQTSLINEKPKRERVKVGDPDFEPPDGGWGWFIVFACGLSNLCSYPMIQQYGLVFKEKFKSIGISQSETITIVNLCIAFNTGVALINGPVFKRFTQRQVALFCTGLVVVSLIACSFCATFWTYVLFYSILYGGGFGLLESANALAINTYFKKKRRIATGFTWTATGFGPIVCPFIVIYFNDVYGVNGTILLFAGLAMHSFICALFLHPVEWHTKFRDEVVPADKLLDMPEREKDVTQDPGRLSRVSSSLFGSQYFGNETGYEISESGNPMVLRDNDGWYSETRSRKNSKFSIYSSRDAEQKSGISSVVGSYNNIRDPKENISEQVDTAKDTINNSLVYSNEHKLLNSPVKDLSKYEKVQDKEQQLRLLNDTTEGDLPERLSFWEKIAHDFDLDLLKDPIFVNLMLGITLANFVEMNFASLTPLILAEFNFEQTQIAAFMSLLAATDIVVRFFVSFVADRIPISSRYFFLIGIVTMVLGRVILMHTQTYYVGLFVAIVIGAGKALRTIFIMLVIPSYVPLERLPAAFGLQFASCGLTFILFGPLAGWIRETVGNYMVTLHILQACSYLTAFCWITESLIKIRKTKRKKLQLDRNISIRSS